MDSDEEIANIDSQSDNGNDGRTQNFTSIQTKRFRRPIPFFGLCPSMDLVALGSGSNEGGETSDAWVAAESVAVHRIVSWQRLLNLSLDELCSPADEWDLESSDNDLVDDESKIKGATSLSWSPDGRCIAIGLADGGVLIYNVEPETSEDNGEDVPQRPLHVVRTITHNDEAVEEKTETEDVEPQEEMPVPKKTIAFSPRVTRSMTAKKSRSDTSYIQSTLQPDTSPAQLFGNSKAPYNKSSAVIGLSWKRAYPHHSSFPLSEAEYEQRETWKYTSTLIDRGMLFLPKDGGANSNGIGVLGGMFSPRSHLNVLLAATGNDLYWFLQSRYRILTNPLNFGMKISSVKMVCSPDTSTVICIACSLEGRYAPRAKLFSCPLLKSNDLQILSASYCSIFSKMQSIKLGFGTALSSWISALRPLDTKFQRLFQLLKNYNVASERGAESIRAELVRFILSGRSTVVGDASNALDQFFTRPDMHDALLTREASGIKASVASIESKLRAGVHREIRALVYDVEELYGVIKASEVTASCTLVNGEMALRLYNSSRILFLTCERFLAYIVEARSRINDFLAWMRGTVSEVRARGTAADSIQRQHARERVSSSISLVCLNYARVDSLSLPCHAEMLS
jgi:hypothetical protein